jgi:hypothetical protein
VSRRDAIVAGLGLLLFAGLWLSVRPEAEGPAPSTDGPQTAPVQTNPDRFEPAPTPPPALEEDPSLETVVTCDGPFPDTLTLEYVLWPSGVELFFPIRIPVDHRVDSQGRLHVFQGEVAAARTDPAHPQYERLQPFYEGTKPFLMEAMWAVVGGGRLQLVPWGACPSSKWEPPALVQGRVVNATPTTRVFVCIEDVAVDEDGYFFALVPEIPCVVAAFDWPRSRGVVERIELNSGEELELELKMRRIPGTPEYILNGPL